MFVTWVGNLKSKIDWYLHNKGNPTPFKEQIACAFFCSLVKEEYIHDQELENKIWTKRTAIKFFTFHDVHNRRTTRQSLLMEIQHCAMGSHQMASQESWPIVMPKFSIYFRQHCDMIVSCWYSGLSAKKCNLFERDWKLLLQLQEYYGCNKQAPTLEELAQNSDHIIVPKTTLIMVSRKHNRFVWGAYVSLVYTDIAKPGIKN